MFAFQVKTTQITIKTWASSPQAAKNNVMNSEGCPESAILSVREYLDCGHLESDHSDMTRGYGVDKDGEKHCYECCAKQDRESMIETGKATLYLCSTDTRKCDRVTNWPNSLSFHIPFWKEGAHNMAGKRYDVWFRGPDGAIWHGAQYGDNTQLCHCQRTKYKTWDEI